MALLDKLVIQVEITYCGSSLTHLKLLIKETATERQRAIKTETKKGRRGRGYAEVNHKDDWSH